MKRAAPSLNRHFTSILCLALLAALAAAGAGWLRYLEERGAQLRESRFQFSLNSVKSTLESGLQLGLALPDLPNAQAPIEDVRVQEPGILSIDVFDTQGRILFTTDRNGIGAHLPAAWRAPCLAPGAGWRARDDDGYLRCIALQNGYEQVAGGVLLRYTLASRAGTFGALSERWPAALLLTAVLAALGAGAGWLSLRPLERRLNGLAGDIAAQRPVADGWLAGPLPAALAALQRREEQLRTAEREADRIDDLDLH